MNIQKPGETEEQYFTRLMELSYRKIYNLLKAATKNTSQAEDLTQETFVRAYRAFSNYDKNKSFDGWVHRIATNLFLDLKRNQKRKISLVSFSSLLTYDFELVSKDNSFEPVDESPNAEQQISNQLVSHQLAQVLNTLDKDELDDFCSLSLGETSIKDLSEKYNAAPGTIRSRVHRTRKKLQRSFLESKETCFS